MRLIYTFHQQLPLFLFMVPLFFPSQTLKWYSIIHYHISFEIFADCLIAVILSRRRNFITS